MQHRIQESVGYVSVLGNRFGTIILGAGGAGAIIAGVVKFAVGQISQQLTLQYKSELDSQIERLKADLANRNHSYQAKFDKEIELYSKLMPAAFEMAKTTFWLFPIAFDHPPQDFEKKAFYQKRDESVHKSLNETRQILDASAVFMPEHIYNVANELLKLCQIQFDLYPMAGPMKENRPEYAQIAHECLKRTEEISDKYDELTKELRRHIEKMTA